MRFAIGIDLGGTNLRVALVSEEGAIVLQEGVAVGGDRTPEKLVQKVKVFVQKVAEKEWPNIAGIGMGVPGLVHFEKGVVLQSPHYPQWKEVPFRRLLEEALGKTVVIDNDANMAAMGELWQGEGRHHPSFITITLGTGVGGALVLNGKLWRGEEGFAGEVGHITVEANGSPCKCGNRGCWETYVSAQGRDLEEIMDEKFWQEFGRYFAIGICSLVNVTGIYTVIIGGGVSASWERFYPAAQKELAQHIYAAVAPRVRLIRSKIFDKAALLGAAHVGFSSPLMGED